MNAADKHRAWAHITKNSPHQVSFIHALKESFSSIELVSYQVIKNSKPFGDESSNLVLADTGTPKEGVSICNQV